MYTYVFYKRIISNEKRMGALESIRKIAEYAMKKPFKN